MGGEDFEGEDEEKSAALNKKWQELSNLQSTLRSFSHEMTEEQLDKAHATEDELRSALGLDAIPRKAHRKQTALLPGGNGGHGGKAAGKGKGKGKSAQSPRSAQDDDAASLRLAERLNAEDDATSSGSEASEQGNRLTEEEEHTTMQVVQDFNLGIEEVYLVQIQRRQARGEAFTDVAELVTEVINYNDMVADSALAHALSEQDAEELPAREPEPQRMGKRGKRSTQRGIKDSDSDSASSDEEARMRRRRARVTQKPADTFRLPGAAARKPPQEGAFLRSLEQEQFYEDLDGEDNQAWQTERKNKTAQYTANIEAMQHKWQKQNGRSGQQQNQQNIQQQKQKQKQNSPQRNKKGLSSPSRDPSWTIPPPPDAPPLSAAAERKDAEIQELRREIERMRRHQQEQLKQVRQANSTQSQRSHSQTTAAEPALEGSWLHTARKDTAADPTLIFGGAGAPPRAIEDAVHWWPFLQRYIVECLITTGKTTWGAIDPMLADSLRRPSLLPLERFLQERWGCTFTSNQLVLRVSPQQSACLLLVL